MEVEGRRITDDKQIDLIAFQKTGYALYQLVKMADLAKRLVYHCGFADGDLQQFTAGLSHLWASDTDKFDIVAAFLQSSYQTCTVGVGTWVGDADKDAILFVFVRHRRIC